MCAIGDGHNNTICASTSAAKSPEEIRILVFVGRDVFSRGKDYRELDCVVDACSQH